LEYKVGTQQQAGFPCEEIPNAFIVNEISGKNKLKIRFFSEIANFCDF